jgi:glycosyltransferase involved in cell wall biosynthesis
MIEAMACGTPVLGFRGGSVPEIIDDHITGRIVDTVDEAIHATPEMTRLDRRAVRRRFEERFSSRRMANDYVEVYRRLGRGAKLGPDHAASALGPNIIPLHRSSGREHRAS